MLAKITRAITFANLIMLALFLAYTVLFWNAVSDYWFHPAWTTDDALQQIYPFHKVFHPNLFKGDLITEMMESYLPPVHYWISYAITYLTGDPIKMSHWVMLLQISLTVGFIFAAVYAATGFAPAAFSALWMLHTRHIMQRLTAGLPRGWAAVIFAAFLFFAIKQNRRAIIATLLIGCVLHPPATMLIAVAYGLILVYELIFSQDKKLAWKNFWILMLVSPIMLLLTLSVLTHSPEIGHMASYDEAAAMPEFSRPSGRFPFVPLLAAWPEIKSFGFQAFLINFYNPGFVVRALMPSIVLGILFALFFAAYKLKRELIPKPIICFGIAALIIYFLSRIFAFKMYVPNRHIQFPFAIFFVTAFSIGVWRALYFFVQQSKAKFDYSDSSLSKSALSLFGLALVAGIVYLGSGLGLQGTMNFNYNTTKKGGIWLWVKANTPETSLIAGQPTLIDGVQLFGARQGYVTTETSHPFYDAYYKEMKRRLEITIKAHYAKDLTELVNLLKLEKIDYFVFNRRDFYPEALKKATYYVPFDTLVKGLVTEASAQFAYKELPAQVDLKLAPYMPYKDGYAAIVDINRLAEFLAINKKEPI